jgi:hypothetical protein
MEQGTLTTDDLARGGTAGDGDATEPVAEPTDTNAPLLDSGESDAFSRQWTDVQAAFVDEPRQAVERADALVAEVMQQLATSFATERQRLEGQWDRGEDVSTEDLRVALTRYRSFFQRLLSA